MFCLIGRVVIKSLVLISVLVLLSWNHPLLWAADFPSDEEEVRLGRQLKADLIAQDRLRILNPSREDIERVHIIGTKLASISGRQGLFQYGGWEFSIIELANGPNAWSIPGGFLFVDYRFMQSFRNDDELAFVLGHEIGHVINRDFFRDLDERGILLNNVVEAWKLLLSLLNGELKRSREQELQADETGIKLMSQAGYDPRWAILWLGKMGENEDADDIVLKRIRSTHPPWVDRILNASDYIQNEIQNRPPSALASTISGQSKIMSPGVEYSVTAEYTDPDGRDDLKYCYLLLQNPLKPLVMIWSENPRWEGTWESELGKNYLSVKRVDAQEIHNGYRLTWHFRITNQKWPEVKNRIDFGVFAVDDKELQSGLSSDNTNASFFPLITASPPEVVSTSPASDEEINPGITRITVIFNERVGPGRGNISIIDGSGHSLNIVSEVTVVGRTLYINLKTLLVEAGSYDVAIASGSVKNSAGLTNDDYSFAFRISSPMSH